MESSRHFIIECQYCKLVAKLEIQDSEYNTYELNYCPLCGEETEYDEEDDVEYEDEEI